jgi:hypothetical protein
VWAVEYSGVFDFLISFFSSPTVISCLITHHANMILRHFLTLLFP